MKFLKNNLKVIIAFILGLILAGGIIYAATSAKEVTYTTTKNTEIKNVEEALNDLYNIQKNLIIQKSLSELKTGTVNIENNTKNTLYAALFSYTGSSNASSIIRERTSIKTIIGAEYEELFYNFNPSSSYGIAIYKLKNCNSSISITTGSNERSNTYF